MAQEINLGGTIYISSKRAAEITGYTQDYIGQLSRGGQIIAQRVSGLWYVVEESLRNYKAKADEFKPTPPPVVRQENQIESSVSFDGKDYVSTQRAAEITGYHPDYVSQLARNGKVLSRQVGNRWFVDREAVVEHKRHNDALLAAVQAESVGLQKNIAPVEAAAAPALHYSYSRGDEERAPLPEMESRENDMTENNDISDDLERDNEAAHEIPIRVIRPATIEKTPRPHAHFERTLTTYRSSRLTTGIVTLTTIALLVVGVGTLYAFERPLLLSGYIRATNAISSIIDATHLPHLAPTLKVPQFILDLVGNELHYRRDSF